MDTNVDFGELESRVSPLTIRDLIDKLCHLLEENGEESFFVTVNSEFTADQHGTQGGKNFLHHNLWVVEKFQEFCGSYRATRTGNVDHPVAVKPEPLPGEDSCEKLSPLKEQSPSLRKQKETDKIDSEEKDNYSIDDEENRHTDDAEIDEKEHEIHEYKTSTGLKLESNICEICGRTYQSKHSLSRHLRICHEGLCKWYTCSQCSAKFKEKNLLTRHVNHKHTQTIVATCASCGKGFHSVRNLRDHEVVHSGGRYKCKHCGKLFVSRTTLEGHINKYHLKINPFACSLCSREFPYKTSLKYHMETKHSDGVSNSHTCKECGQEFKNRYAYLKHTNVTKTDKKFCTRHCGRNVKKNSNMLQENCLASK